MRSSIPISYIFLIIASWYFNSGCVNTRFLKEGEILFKANKVELKLAEPIEKEGRFRKEIASVSQLQPNKRFLGLAKTRLWFYNVSSKRKPTKFRFWVKNKIGEPPVFYDPVLADKSTTLMRNFLINKGYLYADVRYETELKKRKATVTYYIDAKKLYKINTVNFPEDSSRINGIINSNKEDSYLNPEDAFDVSKLKMERERIADDLRNEGYFYFNKEFVYFDLDSNRARQKLDVFVRINSPTDTTDHQIYYINNIYVMTDFSIEQLRTAVKYDTVKLNEYYFVSQELKYRPRILISAIHFKKGELYKKKNHSNTINHLSDLGVFKYVDVKFVIRKIDGKNYLDCLVNLSPDKKQEVSAETEINSANVASSTDGGGTGNNLGMAVILGYKNRNIFRGTELLSLSASGGFESNLQLDEPFFNTADLNMGIDLYFNQFIAPFRLKSVPKFSRPKTRISLRNEYLQRIGFFTSNSTSLTFGYDWRGSKTTRHLFNPIVINRVNILTKEDKFSEILAKSLSLRNSFTEQLILGSEYNFIWSNKAVTKNPGFFYYRGGIDFSGNILHGIMSLVHLNDDDEQPYELFDVPYAQYFRVTSDLRNYLKVTAKSSFVTRILAGIGVPYGNSSSLVYIKQFFSGGANSMRAWRIRSLGPGAFNYKGSDLVPEDGNFFFDQTGEMKIEGNMELRFDIFKFFKGAIFLDVGNVWTLQADSTRPGAHFYVKRFYKEFAIAAGLGFRVDFSYFVLRFDWGIKVRDPATGNDRWPITNYRFGTSEELKDYRKVYRKDNMGFNLAIGYPF